MKKLSKVLLATMLVMMSEPLMAEENTVCQAQFDENGVQINVEEYVACLEENGYGVETLELKNPDHR